MTSPTLDGMTKTPWFQGTVKPRRKGVYQTRDNGLRQTYFNYWDGKTWTGGWDSPEEAMDYRRRGFRNPDDPVDAWRGLAKKP